MNINWRVRFKNPHFVAQVVLSVILPILAYMGMSLEDLTTWGKVGDLFVLAVKNPYVLGIVTVSVYNAVTDPTTKGVGDSERAKSYEEPQ